MPMVIALGNVIRMCMEDDVSFWVPRRQNAAPKGKKILQHDARMSNSTKKLNVGDVHDPRSDFRKIPASKCAHGCNAKPTRKPHDTLASCKTASTRSPSSGTSDRCPMRLRRCSKRWPLN
jgi:hypothetical protein